jgi:hypothetical protein
MSLGITVDFTANLAKFSGQMDQMAGKLDQFQRRAETMSSRINGAFSALGVGISAAGLVSFVKSGIDAADALNDMADRSGIAIEKLAGLEYAVKLGDTSMEAFVASSNKLSINVSKNAEDFAKLGITAKDPVETFKQLADVFSGIDDPQQRAAFGAATLGKTYAEMAPLLMQGAAGIQALIDKGIEHNPITEKQAKLAGEFNDKLDELSSKSMGFRTTFSIGVLSPLASFAEEIDKAMEKSGVFLGTLQGLSNGYKNFSLSENGAGGGLSKELDDLNVKIAETKQTLRDKRVGPNASGGQPPVVIKAEETLNALLQERSELLKKITDQRRADVEKPTNPKTDSTAIDNFNNKVKDETDESGKKFAAASKHVEKYRTEIDSLNKSLSDTAERLAKQRPENLLSLQEITATPEQQSEFRRKSLVEKNIEFDKANKTGNFAEAARIAQEREQLAFDNAREDLYGVKSGELPSYKAFDAKQNYSKAIEASKKALDRFQAGIQTGVTGQPDVVAIDGKSQTQGKPGTVDGKTDVATQISQFEQLGKLMDRVEKPIKIDVSSNAAEQISLIDQLLQRMATIDSSVTNGTASGASDSNNTAQSLSTEVLKRGSRV